MANVWFNLHRRDWTVKVGKAPVTHHAALRLVGCTFRVQEGARQTVLRTKCRSVHAYVVGDLAEVGPVPTDAVQVSYNPYRGPCFYRKDTGADVRAARVLHFLPDGTVWAEDCR